MMNFELWFQQQYPQHAKLSSSSIQCVLKLAAEGSTIPFIARYRKEQTGNLNEVEIQMILEGQEAWDAIVKRKEFILAEIAAQEKLTPELKEKIESAWTLSTLEDLYLPYKKKRKTKATLAKEAGLEPLANWIWNCAHGTEKPQPGQTLELWSLTFCNEKAGYENLEKVLQGAQDILVERLSETQELREYVRGKYFQEGFLNSSKGTKPKEHSKYENYFNFSERINSLQQSGNSHRYLAIRRGWIEEELKLQFGGRTDDANFEESLIRQFEKEAISLAGSPGEELLKKAAKVALKAHVIPSIESEVHKALKEVADTTAIEVFSENVRKLILQPPYGAKAVLGVDPGIRTGCKAAIIDAAGKFIASTVLFLQTDEQKQKSQKLLGEVVRNTDIQAIAVGNGTAGRETEIFIRNALKAEGFSHIPVVMVNEAGASVYSASEIAREEFPELDVSVRGAISIARRLQDPLAELVKIDPKSIGVGQYQHDVSQPSLKRSLERVVESCVNKVGVNLQTASYALLGYVSGIGPSLARSIVEFREKNGVFKNRSELLEVPRFSQKAFEQAAGFLRVPDSTNPLENTGVHPERYSILETFAAQQGITPKDLLGEGVQRVKENADLRTQLGEFTFQDLIQELAKPGRDPRDVFVPVRFRDDIHELEDLKEGMVCPGVVTNVTNFGAFVDIGVHQDGLVHLSQLSHQFVKDPKTVVSPGDLVQVKVLGVDLEKRQISLSMKLSEKPVSAVQPRTASQSRPSTKLRGEGAPKVTPPSSTPPRVQLSTKVNSDKNKKPAGPAGRGAFNNPFATLLAGYQGTNKK